MKISNWGKTMLVLLAIIFCFIFPPTRQFIIFLLPLGSGIDDLLFFIVLTITVIVFALRSDHIERLTKWFSK